MKFSLISDMHLNHPQLKTPYDLLEENVVVAGDTADGLLGLKFLNKLRRKGHKVFAVDGNHEHYGNVAQGRTLNETVDRFRQDNVSREFFEGVPVVGVNGWYKVSDPLVWFNYMNDGRYSVGSDAMEAAQAINGLALEEANQLRYYLDGLDSPTIVVTHTAPSEDTLDPRFSGHSSNEYYHSPHMRQILSDYRDKILVWCHGHTHAFADKVVDGVRVVCNPRGYPRENPSWKPFTIEV